MLRPRYKDIDHYYKVNGYYYVRKEDMRDITVAIKVRDLAMVNGEVEEIVIEEIVKREICPECDTHIQGDNEDCIDCKNLVVDDISLTGMVGKVLGQCCCWSEAHGKKGGF